MDHGEAQPGFQEVAGDYIQIPGRENDEFETLDVETRAEVEDRAMIRAVGEAREGTGRTDEPELSYSSDSYLFSFP